MFAGERKQSYAEPLGRALATKLSGSPEFFAVTAERSAAILHGIERTLHHRREMIAYRTSADHCLPPPPQSLFPPLLDSLAYRLS